MLENFKSLIIVISISLIATTSVMAALDLKLDLPAIGIKPKTGVAQPSANFTPIRQQKLANELLRQLRRKNRLVNIPEVEAYITELGQKLVRLSGNYPHNFKFFVLNSNEVNAFAGFGGIIGINQGLILTARSEGELASVMAHEIAHVSQRHLARAMENAGSAKGIISQALLLALAVAAGKNNPEVSAAAATTALGVRIQKGINYTRAHELEADSIGINILAAAGYNPRGMTSFMTRMLQMQRFSNNSAPSYLLTHPLAADRVARAAQKARKFSKRGIKNTESFNTIRQLIKSNNSSHYSGAKSPNSDSAKITRAIGLAKTGNKAAALKLVKRVRSNNIYIKLLLGNFFAQIGNQQAAQVQYKQAYTSNPNNIATVKRYAQILLNNGNLATTQAILNQALVHHPEYPDFNRLMAKINALQGKVAQSYLWQAQYEFYSGRTKNAIKQLQIASRQVKNDFYLGAKINAKLKEYQRIRRLEK